MTDRIEALARAIADNFPDHAAGMAAAREAGEGLSAAECAEAAERARAILATRFHPPGLLALMGSMAKAGMKPDYILREAPKLFEARQKLLAGEDVPTLEVSLFGNADLRQLLPEPPPAPAADEGEDDADKSGGGHTAH